MDNRFKFFFSTFVRKCRVELERVTFGSFTYNWTCICYCSFIIVYLYTLRGLILENASLEKCFREWPSLKNFAWIYFRENSDFEKYFSLKKKEKRLCFQSKAFKSLYKHVNNFYMFDGVPRQKHYTPHLDHTRHCPNHIVHCRRHDHPLRIEVAILRSQRKYRRDQYLGSGQDSIDVGSEGTVWRKANIHCFRVSSDFLKLNSGSFCQFFVISQVVFFFYFSGSRFKINLI